MTHDPARTPAAPRRRHGRDGGGARTRARCLVLALTTVLSVATIAGCSADLSEIGGDNPDFERCLGRAGVSLDGSDGWDSTRQRELWSEPGAIDCALDELDDAAREDALSGAFLDDEEDEADDSRESQWEVIGRWAARTTESASVEVTVERGASLLQSLWVADDDAVQPADGMSRVVVVEALHAAGDLDSYDRYLSQHPDADDSADLMVAFMGGIGDSRPDPDEQSRYYELSDDLAAAVRG